MSDFMTTDKAVSLLVIASLYVCLTLYLRWLKRIEESMPVPEAEPCGNCGSIDAYPRHFVFADRGWVAYTCPDCSVQMPPVQTGTTKMDREDVVLALTMWNKTMRE